MTTQSFTFRFPFQTKCRWPARLLGVVQRTAFPYVVAVWNPAFNAEEIHCYSEDGKQPVDFTNHSDQAGGAVDGALSLVNLDDEAYLAVARNDLVHAHFYSLPSIPAGDNPFLHDAANMGTALVRGWMVMHEGFGNAENTSPLRGGYFVNWPTGQRIGFRFTPMHPIELNAKTNIS